MLFCAGKKEFLAVFCRWHLTPATVVRVFAQDAWGEKVSNGLFALFVRSRQGFSLSAGKWKVFHRKRVPGISSHAHDRPRFITTYIVQFAMIFSPRRHIAGKPKVDTRTPFQRLLFLLSLES